MKLSKFAGKIEVGGKELVVSYDDCSQVKDGAGAQQPMLCITGIDSESAQQVIAVLQGGRRRHSSASTATATTATTAAPRRRRSKPAEAAPAAAPAAAAQRASDPATASPPAPLAAAPPAAVPARIEAVPPADAPPAIAAQAAPAAPSLAGTALPYPIPQHILDATMLRDVIVWLQDERKIRGQVALQAECEALRAHIPCVATVKDLPARIARLLDFIDSGAAAATGGNSGQGAQQTHAE